MFLYMHSDRSYLSVWKSRSRAGSCYLLSSKESASGKASKNGAVRVLYKILNNIIVSSAETEIALAFENSKEAIYIRNALAFLDHS